MFQSSTALPHLLAPPAYFDAEIFHGEVNHVLRSAWHLVGTIDSLPRSGDFRTTSILGTPLQLRNFAGKLAALSNVCAHRHCLLSDQAAGHAPSMRCQYHGWEYGEDGFTRKIPCAKDFAPIDRAQLRLTKYRLESAGQLMFVCLDPDAPSLADFLGPIAALVRERFGDGWRRFYQGQFDYQANWKVAIENSLEAYHVESIHSQTFGIAPGEQRTEHRLGDRHTAFLTDLPFAAHHRADQLFQKSEAWMVRRLGKKPDSRYQQHHVFPNLLFSFTDAISLIHCVQPLAPTQSQSLVLQFGIYPKGVSLWQRWLAAGLGRAETMILKRIMQEDIRLYPNIQRGLIASSHCGTLARSEERIHAFQAFMLQAMRVGSPHAVQALDEKEVVS